jgi:hypothetical protein
MRRSHQPAEIHLDEVSLDPWASMLVGLNFPPCGVSLAWTNLTPG